MDGQNPQNEPAVQASSGHSDLPHDQPVSLRQPVGQVPLEPTVEPDFRPPAAVVEPQPAYQVPPTQPPAESVVPAALQAPASPYADPEPAYDVDLIPADNQLTWTASEFIDHPKTSKWYLALAGISLVLLALAFLITRGDIITLIFLLITFGLFGYMASRRPRQLSYALSRDGLSVGMKLYHYTDFRAFSFFEEGHFASMNLLPLKRFAPALSVYFDPQQLDAIGEILSQHLPYVQHRPTLVDNLMHRIRF